MSNDTSSLPAYPAEIQSFHDALLRLPGVQEVSSSIESLQSVTGDDLASALYAHLPQGALRRTDGGLPDEALIQFEFRLTPNAEGWRSLEFLAWWTRDAARSDKAIQLRPFALLPRAGAVAQFGHTLRFHIDLFLPDAAADLAPLFAKVAELTRTLTLAMTLYAAELQAS